MSGEPPNLVKNGRGKEQVVFFIFHFLLSYYYLFIFCLILWTCGVDHSWLIGCSLITKKKRFELRSPNWKKKNLKSQIYQYHFDNVGWAGPELGSNLQGYNYKYLFIGLIWKICENHIFLIYYEYNYPYLKMQKDFIP